MLERDFGAIVSHASFVCGAFECLHVHRWTAHGVQQVSKVVVEMEQLVFVTRMTRVFIVNVSRMISSRSQIDGLHETMESFLKRATICVEVFVKCMHSSQSKTYGLVFAYTIFVRYNV